MNMLEVAIHKMLGDFVIDARFVSRASGVTALFGKSGAGKTSVINMVAGLVRPDNGRIAVAGRTLFDSTSAIDLPPEKRRIGYIFQDGRLFPHLSVRSNLTYGMHLTPKGQRYVTLDQVVALLGIEHLLNRRPAKLSGGEKQRVAIGRALLTSPSLLLMDEPLASLDSARKSEVLPFIARLSRELSVPILYVSHSLNEIINLADTIVIINAGQVVAAGKLEDITSRIDLQDIIGTSGYGNIINTVIQKHQDGLTRLKFAGGALSVLRLNMPEGAPIRVRIQAANVAVAVERPQATSIQNIFKGTIEEIVARDGRLVDISINIGCRLLARITQRALIDLNLKPGKSVYALIKSVSVSSGDLAPTD